MKKQYIKAVDVIAEVCGMVYTCYMRYFDGSGSAEF